MRTLSNITTLGHCLGVAQEKQSAIVDAVVGPKGLLVTHILCIVDWLWHHISLFSLIQPGIFLFHCRYVNLGHLVMLVSASLHSNVTISPFVINKYCEERYPGIIPKLYCSWNLSSPASAHLMTRSWINNNCHYDSYQRVIFCFHPSLLYSVVFILLKGKSFIWHCFIYFYQCRHGFPFYSVAFYNNALLLSTLKFLLFLIWSVGDLSR